MGGIARGIRWDMSGFLKQCVDVYYSLAGENAPKPRKVISPFIDQKAEPYDESENRGALASVASKILMKILCAARMASPDLLRAICYLATKTTIWTKQIDKRFFSSCMLHTVHH